MFRFEELEIWKLSIAYADDCYTIADNFPQHERYALADQLRRACVSPSNNIAEGSAKGSKEFCKFLDIAIGSLLETVNILFVAQRRKYVVETQRLKMYGMAEELIRKTRAFKNSLR